MQNIPNPKIISGSIGLYKGAFDPPNLAHLYAIEKFLNDFNLSKIFVYIKYIGVKDYYTSVNQRIEMMNIQLKDRNLPVEIIKQNLNGYKAEIEKLYRVSNKLVVNICGLDKIIDEINNYGNSQHIAFGLIRRIGYFSKEKKACNLAMEKGLSIFSISPEKSPSSTNARKLIKNKGDTKDILDPKITNYIKLNNLYIPNNSENQKKVFFDNFDFFINKLKNKVNNFNLNNIKKPHFEEIQSMDAWNEKYIRTIVKSLDLKGKELINFVEIAEDIFNEGKLK